MKIVINTAHQRFGGGIQVALSFINECINYDQNEYHIWVGQGVGRTLDKTTFPNNFEFYDFDFGIINFKSIRLIQTELSKIENTIKPDIIFSTSGPSYFNSKAPQIIGYNLPLYIYPESPFVYGLSRKAKLKLALKRMAHFYYFKRDAVAYVTQTDDVKLRVKKALKTTEVHTVTNTASNYYFNWKTFSNKLPKKTNAVFRFLSISSYYEHKNLDLIPQVINELSKMGISNVQFILTLKEEDFLKHIGKQKKIINVGPISPHKCPSLYAECDALFLPTLAECFSASYPEAMVMSKPIVTTDLGFAKSICGRAALYFQAKNAQKAALQIKKLIGDKNLQQQLISIGKEQLKSFDTPSQRAKKYLELCQKYV